EAQAGRSVQPAAQLREQNDTVSTTDRINDGFSARINQTKITTGKGYFQDHLNLISVQHKEVNKKNIVTDFYFDKKKAKNLGADGALIWAVVKIEEYLIDNPGAKVIAICGDDLPAKVIEYMLIYAALQRQKGEGHFACVNTTHHHFAKDFPSKKDIEKLDKKINDSSHKIYGVLKELGIRKKKLEELQRKSAAIQEEMREGRNNIE
ncbi:MAG: hypothetical protein JO149_09845, partial [Gammaproteobacteria bacterium]|nr:hypothetical protein [Gammaproteobacteria bacterium]